MHMRKMVLVLAAVAAGFGIAASAAAQVYPSHPITIIVPFTAGGPSDTLTRIDLGLEVFLREQQTTEALAAYHKADVERWWPIIKALESGQSEPGRSRDPKLPPRVLFVTAQAAR
jgi:hypothetical protein